MTNVIAANHIMTAVTIAAMILAILAMTIITDLEDNISGILEASNIPELIL